MASPSNPRISAVNPRQLPLPSRTSPMPRALSAATAAVLTSAPSSLTLDQPRFDLGFDKVQGRMDSFLSNLSQTIVRGRQRFMNDKNDYLQQLNQLQETQKRIESEIKIYLNRVDELTQQRSAQQREILESKESIENFTQTKHQMERFRDSLKQNINEIHTIIQAKKEEQRKDREILDKQIAHIDPELLFWEKMLGLRIEGVTEDVLRFRFTNIDAENMEKPFIFTLDLSKQEYLITKCSPLLQKPIISQILKNLNESHRFDIFLKQMWRAFKDHAAGQVGRSVR